MTVTAPPISLPVPAPPPLRNPKSAFRNLLAAVLAILIFAASFYLFTRHNTFPLRYHPDEPTKVDQILSDSRNYNHPTMMLDLTVLAMKLGHVSDDPQPVVEAGRDVSAFFAAGCVTFMAIAAYIDAGIVGMILAAIVVATCPFLFTYAHYMKEDAGLMFGVGMFVLATRVFFLPLNRWWKQLAAIVFLGLAASVATSGKYVGIASVAVGGPLLFFGQRRWSFLDLFLRPFVYFLTVALSLYALNYRAAKEWSDARGAVHSSLIQPLYNEFNNVVPVPSAYWLHMISEVTPWHIKALAAVAVLMIFFTKRHRSAWTLLMVFTTVFITVMLCFGCRLAFQRYCLPAVVLIHLLAGLSLAWLWEECRGLGSRGVLAIVIVAALSISIHDVGNALYQFGHDSRDELRAWLDEHGQDGQTVAADAYTGFRGFHGGLSDSVQPNKVRVDSATWVANMGEIDQLKSNGYTYIAICDLAYARYIDPSHCANNRQEDMFDHHRDWYNKLMKDEKLVWQSHSTPNLNAYTNPEIRLYRIDGK